MIEYDNTIKVGVMFFAGDGSWGDASDLTVIDITELDGHFTEFIDELHDYQRPDFMRWYVENQTHDQLPQDSSCEICNLWESGTEDEIQAELEEEE